MIGVSILARLEGRALPKSGSDSNNGLTVSILARLEGRALPGFVTISERFICFNPRPSRRTGATGYFWADNTEDFVSILARLEGRALPINGQRHQRS